MERLTDSEQVETMCALKDRVVMAWREAICCDRYNQTPGFEFWVKTAANSWNAWNKVIEWPWVNDSPPKDMYEETFTSVYQEPDSFYTYNELDSTVPY